MWTSVFFMTLHTIKSHIEYGPSLVTRAEAEKIAKDAERFVDRAEGVLKKIP